MKRAILFGSAAAVLTLTPALFTPAMAQTELLLWEHETANQAELDFFADAIAEFNDSQSEFRIVRELIPEGSYTNTIQAAAAAGTLPCVFDMDQPVVPSFAWGGHVAELTPYLGEDFADAFTTGARGTYQDRLYSVGLWDAALTLYSTQSTLDEYGFRAATVEEPYTADEFSEILETITASGDFNFAIDVESGTQGEWFAYAFAPLIQSAGGDLIDRSTFLTAEGVANGPEAVEAATWFQSLFVDGHASTNSGGGGLANGETAFHYSGSWNYGPLKEQFGDDLVVMPLPDMGNGPVIGAASWQWGVSASCEHPEAAADFIAMLMTPEKIAEASNATSLIPVSAEALPMSDYYQDGQEARIFFEFADRFAMLRPETPGYPFISSTFERVFRDIMNGADVQSALDGYVDAVEINIADNQGYGFE